MDVSISAAISAVSPRARGLGCAARALTGVCRFRFDGQAVDFDSSALLTLTTGSRNYGRNYDESGTNIKASAK